MDDSSTSNDLPDSKKPEERKSLFDFPYQLSTSGCQGYIANPLAINLNGRLSISCWLLGSDNTYDCRTFISIESAQCKSSLLSLQLPGSSMNVNLAYMVDDRTPVNILTEAIAPGPQVFFHFALIMSGQGATVYINGKRQSHNPIEQLPFNPKRKYLVIGRQKWENQVSNSWDGEISKVKVVDYCLSEEDIREQAEEPPMRYVAPLGA